MPQLERQLRYLKNTAQVKRLATLYLLATSDNPSIELRESDTDMAAELARKWLEAQKERGAFPELLGQTGIKVLLMRGRNPADYQEVFDAYKELLVDRLPRPEGEGCVWLCPMAGTPAMTMALVLVGLALWKERVRILVAPEGRVTAEESPFPQRFLRLLGKEALQAALQAYDWEGGMALAAQEGIKGLLRSALERSRFNFSEADRALAQALIHIDQPDLREAVRQLREGLEPLLQPPKDHASAGPFLVELAFNARMCWHTRREVDFLGRVYRLQEGLIRYLLEKADLPTDDSPAVRQKTRPRFWGRVAELGLEPAIGADPAIQKGGPINRPAMLAVLRAMVEREARPDEDWQGRASALLPLLEGPLEVLATLRNQTFLGHHFKPIPRDYVIEEVRPYFPGLSEDPVEHLLKLIINSLDPKAWDWDPFQATVEVARKLLEQSY